MNNLASTFFYPSSFKSLSAARAAVPKAGKSRSTVRHTISRSTLK
jgi:hypothetical protein